MCMGMQKSPVLFIDAYDSFSNNIISLLESELPVCVTKIRIDDKIQNLNVFLEQFAAVVAGPGPGNPKNPEDVGLIADIWTLKDEHLLPVLGICLGFQSLVYAFGGRIERLPQPRHGIETTIITCGSSIFGGFSEIASVQYHSLHAILDGDSKQANPFASPSHWDRRSQCPELCPLAWDSINRDRNPSSDAPSPGILMAVKHISKPFFGVQFHPESICSSPRARCVVRNWWNLSLEWLLCNRPQIVASNASNALHTLVNGNIINFQESSRASSLRSSASVSPSASPPLSSSLPSSRSSLSISNEYTSLHSYQQDSIQGAKLDIPAIIQALGLCNSEIVILDSERRQIPGLSTHSIIGLMDSDTLQLAYDMANKTIKISQAKCTIEEHHIPSGCALSYIKTFMAQHKVSGGKADLPFWGGLMGYITYEACLEAISITSRKHKRGPDIAFAFIERSIVIDHSKGSVYVQSLRLNDSDWICKTRNRLFARSGYRSRNAGFNLNAQHQQTRRLPLESIYKQKILRCQEEIQAGNSYELCLTNQIHVSTKATPGNPSSWKRYLRLRTLNPAPFAAYVRLGPLTVLSTSPERFLSWTRPQPEIDDTIPANASSLTSTCQFRPIKGTVRKRQELAGGESRLVGLEEATAVLSTPKERAENLMIVDLIRHDLSGVLGSGNAQVSSLMSVEEYESVYQLVSVIEGKLTGISSLSSRLCEGSDVVSGIDVLAASLPPGSMTGAPKKRSCELLQSIEDEPRSVYSGVLGYMCAGGGGDFSVVIRTIYKWDNDSQEGTEEWKIGAGGAITTLSNENDEWEEMLTKLRSTLGLFDN